MWQQDLTLLLGFWGGFSCFVFVYFWNWSHLDFYLVSCQVPESCDLLRIPHTYTNTHTSRHARSHTLSYCSSDITWKYTSFTQTAVTLSLYQVCKVFVINLSLNIFFSSENTPVIIWRVLIWENLDNRWSWWSAAYPESINQDLLSMIFF